jgi:hypothetical protein
MRLLLTPAVGFVVRLAPATEADIRATVAA